MTTPLGHEDDLVTGEAVLVALPYAGLPIRTLSGFVDVVVAGLVSVLARFALARFGEGLDDAAATGLLLVVVVGVTVGLPVVCEILTGRTIGKALTGLRTVRDDGAPADARRIITRHLVGVLEVWLTGGAVALLAGLFTEPTRRLGDLAAGTYVVRDRMRLRLPLPPQMPSGLEAWARRADVGRIPDDLAAMVRANIAQREAYTSESAARVEAMLAERLAQHVSPPPPVDTPARAFLLAVMAERRRRETERLAQAEERRRRLFDVSR